MAFQLDQLSRQLPLIDHHQVAVDITDPVKRQSLAGFVFGHSLYVGGDSCRRFAPCSHGRQTVEFRTLASAATLILSFDKALKSLLESFIFAFDFFHQIQFEFGELFLECLVGGG